MLLRLLLAALALLMLASICTAQDRKLYPADKAAQDATFAKFRQTLRAAVKRRDKDFVLSVLDPQIKNSFGGDGGIEEFKKMWKLDQPDSRLWGELETILSMGGSFGTVDGKRNFIAPYVTSMWPGDLDSFEYVAVTGKDVRVRANPGLKAPVVATLSYDIVKVSSQTVAELERQVDGHTWRKIIAPGGKTGYVAEKFVRSPVDYRAYFERKNGRWVLAALIAGD